MLGLTSRVLARTFQAVLFDMDGTLVDSVSAVDRCWSRWAREYGLPGGRLELAHGVPSRQVLAAVVRPADLDAAVRRIEELEVADVDGVTLLPGAARVLASLPPGRAAIATSCTRPLAQARIAASGLAVPSVVVTASDVAVGKPEPAPFLLAARLLGVDPADCLVVEDAPAGVTAARAAGCTSLAVLTTHPRERLEADAAVASLAEVRFVAVPGGVRVLPNVVPA